MTPEHLFAMTGRRKRYFWFFKIALETILASAKWKEVSEQPDRIVSWYWKRKPTWRKDLITYNSHPRIMFPFNWLAIIWRVRKGDWNWTSKVKGWKNLERSWTRRVGGKLDFMLSKIYAYFMLFLKFMLSKSIYIWSTNWTIP